jgi:tRNA modification GTPase
VLVADRSEPWLPEDQDLLDQWPRAVLVHNKCDLPAASNDRPPGLPTSALHGKGVEDLLAAIGRRLVPDPPPPGAAVPLTEQQIDTLAQIAHFSGLTS